ncbi:MAG TPA: hypothetical protein VH497_02860 [Vicinamibacterales bacterium]
MSNLRHLRFWATVGCLLIPLSLVAPSTSAAQKSDKDKDSDSKRPKINLKAQPMIAISPARVVLSAEIVGGPNDYEDFYCAAVEWDWGDGTRSESGSDCEPYEPGKSEIKRHFTVVHNFRAGQFRVTFRLKRGDKSVGFATVSLQIRPGLRETGY